MVRTSRFTAQSVAAAAIALASAAAIGQSCEWQTQDVDVLNDWTVNTFRVLVLDNNTIAITEFTTPILASAGVNTLTAVQVPQNGFAIKAWISTQPCGPAVDRYRYGEAVRVPFYVGSAPATNRYRFGEPGRTSADVDSNRQGRLSRADGAVLQPGQTYYFNAAYEWPPEWGGGRSCGFTACGIKIELSPSAYLRTSG